MIEQNDPDWADHMFTACWGLQDGDLWIAPNDEVNWACAAEGAPRVPFSPLYCQLYVAPDGQTVLLDERMECHGPLYYYEWIEKINHVLACATSLHHLEGVIWREDDDECWSVSASGNSFPIIDVQYPQELHDKLCRQGFIR